MHRRLVSLLFAALCTTAAACAQQPGRVAYDPTPRLGVLVPVGPPDYAVLLDALHDGKQVIDGPFTFRTGTIAGVAVTLIIQPTDGDLPRSLGGQQMLQDFNIRALIYPGTSGGHLPKGAMGVGDIVLGTKNVNHANYYLSPSGEIQAGAFDAMQPTIRHFGALYMDPALLSMLACSAHHVAATTELPASFEPPAADHHPQVFYYGIQGTSTIWSDNQAYTLATMKVFHEIDEDGDWDSALVATLWHVPFVEVSIISNSIFAFPDRSHGTPISPAGVPNSHVYAQRLSNHIALDFIQRYGQQVLRGRYANVEKDPFPAEAYDSPTAPRDLLDGCK